MGLAPTSFRDGVLAGCQYRSPDAHCKGHILESAV